MHGQGRTIVFCTSVAALRHLSSVLRILGIDVWTLHAQMQQRARLKVCVSFLVVFFFFFSVSFVYAFGMRIIGQGYMSFHYLFLYSCLTALKFMKEVCILDFLAFWLIAIS